MNNAQKNHEWTKKSTFPLRDLNHKNITAGMVAGFSLITVFGNSLQQSFSRLSMRTSATFAFIIAMSNITILNISSPVWSLLIGSLIARYIESDTKRNKMETIK